MLSLKESITLISIFSIVLCLMSIILIYAPPMNFILETFIVLSILTVFAIIFKKKDKSKKLNLSFPLHISLSYSRLTFVLSIVLIFILISSYISNLGGSIISALYILIDINLLCYLLFRIEGIYALIYDNPIIINNVKLPQELALRCRASRLKKLHEECYGDLYLQDIISQYVRDINYYAYLMRIKDSGECQEELRRLEKMSPSELNDVYNFISPKHPDETLKKKYYIFETIIFGNENFLWALLKGETEQVAQAIHKFLMNPEKYMNNIELP